MTGRSGPRPAEVARVLVDTDVFVDHLRGVRRLSPEVGEIHYSAITRAELFAGPTEQHEAVRTMLSPFTEHAVDGAVAELGGAISRSASVPLPDALIAAAALAAGLTVLTRNRRHFERVEGLPVRSPG